MVDTDVVPGREVTLETRDALVPDEGVVRCPSRQVEAIAGPQLDPSAEIDEAKGDRT